MNNQFFTLNNDNQEYQKEVIQVGILNKILLPNEDQIHLEVTEIEKNLGARWIEETETYLEIAGGKIGVLAAEFKLNAINQLQTAAEQLSTNPTPCANYLTGLKLFYAFKNGKFTLYYRPVKFCNLSKSYGQGSQLFGQYKLYENANSYFKYSDPNFVEVTDAAEKQAILAEIDAYKIQIKIKHRDTDPLAPFISSVDISGDVCSVIFSFQEMLALGLASYGTSNIRIWNSVEVISYNLDQWNKHGLLLSTENVTSSGGSINVYAYQGSFANLSHMCPPSCIGDFTFRLKA